MQEAKYSFNVKFRIKGFESQFTVRSDVSAQECWDAGMKAIHSLASWGAEPNGRNGSAGTPVQKQVCPVCGKDDQLELIKFHKDGKPREAFKCQRCNRWLPDKK